MTSNSLSNNNYIRPKKTYTELLDENDIEDKLKDYVKVDDICEVKVNTHVRYFSIEIDRKTGVAKRLFRLGGFLKNKDKCDVYVILSNGRTTWSVQTAKTVFYRRLTIEEIKEEYERDISKLQLSYKKILKQNQKMKAKLQELGYTITAVPLQ